VEEGLCEETNRNLLAMTFYCDNKRHLVCVPYSIPNLHRMADSLGIKRCWFHPGRHPHYDIPQMRIMEIVAKCQLVSSREILDITTSETPAHAT
jgi:hypothetical protein